MIVITILIAYTALVFFTGYNIGSIIQIKKHTKTIDEISRRLIDR